MFYFIAIFILICFINFYIIWPLFQNILSPLIKNFKKWQKVLLFIFIWLAVSFAIHWGSYPLYEIIYKKFIVS